MDCTILARSAFISFPNEIISYSPGMFYDSEFYQHFAAAGTRYMATCSASGDDPRNPIVFIATVFAPEGNSERQDFIPSEYKMWNKGLYFYI